MTRFKILEESGSLILRVTNLSNFVGAVVCLMVVLRVGFSGADNSMPACKSHPWDFKKPQDKAPGSSSR